MRLDLLGDEVAVDTETTGLRRWHGDRPFVVSFFDADGQSTTRHWPVDPFTRQVKYGKGDLRELERFFASSRRFVFFHGKFDIQMLGAIDIPPPKVWDDVLVEMRTLRTDEHQYGLKYLAKRYAKYPLDDQDELKAEVVAGRRAGRKLGWKLGDETDCDYHLASRDTVLRYAVGDVERTMLLHKFAQPLLDHEGVRDTYDLEMRLQPVVIAMEERGVRVDLNAVASSMRTLNDHLREIAARIKRDAPGLNPNSPKQLQHLFFEKLRLTPTKFTKTGQPSTDEESLEAMNHPLAKAILESKRIVKQQGFFQRWALEESTSVVHPSFEPQAAGTGRFGCRTPNLQQVPKNDPEYAKLARQVFVPRPGHVWVTGDFSQMELRMLAGLANESRMLNAFASGRDIHRETAVTLWGVDLVESYDKPNGDNVLRSRAKCINFAILYGAGPAKVAAQAGCTVMEAASFLAAYNRAFPGIKRFMDTTISQARQLGFVWTAFGRRLWVDPFSAYVGVNYRIQGSGADVTKRAMIDLQPKAEQQGGGLVLTIHDELAAEIPVNRFHSRFMRTMRDTMQAFAKPFGTPLPVDMGFVTTNWSEKQDVVMG